MRARGASAEADIFDAHLLALDDPAVVGETLKAMAATGLNAEHCFNFHKKKKNDAKEDSRKTETQNQETR